MKAAPLLASALSITLARAADPLQLRNDIAPKQAIIGFKSWADIGMKDDCATI